MATVCKGIKVKLTLKLKTYNGWSVAKQINMTRGQVTSCVRSGSSIDRGNV